MPVELRLPVTLKKAAGTLKVGCRMAMASQPPSWSPIMCAGSGRGTEPPAPGRHACCSCCTMGDGGRCCSGLRATAVGVVAGVRDACSARSPASLRLTTRCSRSMMAAAGLPPLAASAVAATSSTTPVSGPAAHAAAPVLLLLRLSSGNPEEPMGRPSLAPICMSSEMMCVAALTASMISCGGVALPPPAAGLQLLSTQPWMEASSRSAHSACSISICSCMRSMSGLPFFVGVR
mmetsp:Transcript_16480/g.41098  ORF Transcript_16480/g.41098 Transcript_16480/m.41098 type:complete len:234 (+) Transcript_16480:1216-1917(+)